MARDEDWRKDVREAMRHEQWSLRGPTRVVKVMPAHVFCVEGLKGFVGTEQALLGKTPSQIEAALGLKLRSLARGCRVYRFTRLPMPSEVEYELTAKYPDGWAFNPAMHDDRYPPGDATIHQWRLLVDVPVEHLLDLAPGQRYPYLHG